MRIVKAIVGLGQTLAIADHERGAEAVVGLASALERGVALPVLREGESLKAVGRHVAYVGLHRRCVPTRPSLMDTRLKNCECRVVGESEDGELLGIDPVSRNKGSHVMI